MIWSCTPLPPSQSSTSSAIIVLATLSVILGVLVISGSVYIAYQKYFATNEEDNLPDIVMSDLQRRCYDEIEDHSEPERPIVRQQRAAATEMTPILFHETYC